MLALVYIILFSSGLSSLVYQISWVRILSLSIGSSAVSIAIILAVFFSGLAIGSIYAQTLLKKRRNALKLFIWVELIIAVSAIAILPLLFSADQMLALLPSNSTDSILSFALVFALLIVPTIGIGMTYPLMSCWLAEQREQLSAPVSSLFASNTLGAVAGVMLAGFIMIPNLGLDGSVYIAVLINVVTASLAFYLYIYIKPSIHPDRSQTIVTQPHKGMSNITTSGFDKRYILFALSITGFSLMAAEIVWSKYFILYTGNTLHAFSAMIAVVLIGLALGAGLYKTLSRKTTFGLRALAGTLFLLSISLYASRFFLGWLPLQFDKQLYLGEFLSELEGWLLMLMLMPSSLIFGFIFPMLLTQFCQDYKGVRTHLGLAYGINTFFGVLGAIVTSLWLIPRLGSDITLILIGTLPLIALLILTPKLYNFKIRLLSYSAVLSLGIAIIFIPGLNYTQLLSAHYYRFGVNSPPVNFRYISEGRTGIISLVDYGNDVVHLQRNGLKEALVHAKHAYKGTLAESLLGALPYLLQEKPTNAFVIGFGAGTTTRVLANSGLEKVKTIEIEPKVFEAMMQLGEGKFTFLRDKPVELTFNDARVSLLREKEKYSIIASQPSHPWQVGSGNLYSKEFFELVKSRLKDDGIFSQWVNLFRMDSDTLASILKTFYEVFPQGVVFGVMRTGDLLLLGGQQPMVLDYERTKRYFQNLAVAHTLRYGDLRYPEELPNYFLFTSREARLASSGAKTATDANLLIEMRLAMPKQSFRQDDDPYQLIKQYVQTDIRQYKQH